MLRPCKTLHSIEKLVLETMSCIALSPATLLYKSRGRAEADRNSFLVHLLLIKDNITPFYMVDRKSCFINSLWHPNELWQNTEGKADPYWAVWRSQRDPKKNTGKMLTGELGQKPDYKGKRKAYSKEEKYCIINNKRTVFNVGLSSMLFLHCFESATFVYYHKGSATS